MKNISQICKCFTKHLASKKQISDVLPADVKAINIKHCKHNKISTSDLSSCILSLLVGYIMITWPNNKTNCRSKVAHAFSPNVRLDVFNSDIYCSTGKQGWLNDTEGSLFAQSVRMLDVTESMHSFHQPPMNVCFYMQTWQISRHAHTEEVLSFFRLY